MTKRGENTVTEWQIDGEATPEQIDKAARELDLAMVELIYASMRKEFECRYPIEKGLPHER